MRNKMELKKLITILCVLCEHEIKHSATARENLQHKNLQNNRRVNYHCLPIMALCCTVRRHPITKENHERKFAQSSQTRLDPGTSWIQFRRVARLANLLGVYIS
jgi:hypothetical protein